MPRRESPYLPCRRRPRSARQARKRHSARRRRAAAPGARDAACADHRTGRPNPGGAAGHGRARAKGGASAALVMAWGLLARGPLRSSGRGSRGDHSCGNSPAGSPAAKARRDRRTGTVQSAGDASCTAMGPVAIARRDARRGRRDRYCPRARLARDSPVLEPGGPEGATRYLTQDPRSRVIAAVTQDAEAPMFRGGPWAEAFMSQRCRTARGAHPHHSGCQGFAEAALRTVVISSERVTALLVRSEGIVHYRTIYSCDSVG